ncbi:unnamed protein product, partial [Closterium sp. Naga37s-1]
GAMRSGTPPMGGAPRAREALWQRLTGCLDELARVMVLTWHLQRVMAKKRDPISHLVFLDHVLQVWYTGVCIAVQVLLQAQRSRLAPCVPEPRAAGVVRGGEVYGAVWEALLRAFLSQLRATRPTAHHPWSYPPVLLSLPSPTSPGQSGDALPTERVWEALLRAFLSQLRATRPTAHHPWSYPPVLLSLPSPTSPGQSGDALPTERVWEALLRAFLSQLRVTRPTAHHPWSYPPVLLSLPSPTSPGQSGDALPTERVWEALLRAFLSQLRATRPTAHHPWSYPPVLLSLPSPTSPGQSGDALPTERVWEALLRAFSSQLRATFTASSFVKETFVSAYPRLLASLESFLDRLQADTDVRVLGGGGGGVGGGAGGGGFGLGAVGGGSVVAGSWANGGTPAVISVEHRAQMMSALEPFQAAYLALSLSRMTDPINTMMPGAGGGRGGVPGPEAGVRLITRMEEEVEAVKGNGRLLRLVLANAGKALQLLAERCEYQVATGPESRQVLAPCSPAQQRNISLCVLLGAVHSRCICTCSFRCPSPPLPLCFALQVATGPESRQVLAPCSPAQQRNISLCVLLGAVHTRCMQLLARLPEEADSVMEAGVGSVHGVAMDAVAPLFKLLARLPEEADSVMEAGVGSVHGVAMDAVAPLFKAGVGSVHGVAMDAVAPLFKLGLYHAMRDRIEACLLQIHQQDFSSDDPNAPPSFARPSLAKRLASITLLFFARHASLVRPVSEGGCLASRTLLFFVRHASLVRPLSEAGRLRLARDMGELEFAPGIPHAALLCAPRLAGTTTLGGGAAEAGEGHGRAGIRRGAAPHTHSRFSLYDFHSLLPLPPSPSPSPSHPLLSPILFSPISLASRTLLFFVRHASLVRPLSEAGRLRLARDMGELEFAVGQHLFPTHALGASYRALRAFRPLLFVDLEKIPTSSLMQVSPSAHINDSDKSDCSDPWSVMDELEFAVGQHLFPTHALGASYRALRAFRPLLFVDLEKIPTSSLLQHLFPTHALGASYRALRAFRPLLFVDLEKIPTSSLLQGPPTVLSAPSALSSSLTSRRSPPARYCRASYRALHAFRPLLFVDLDKIPTSSLLQVSPSAHINDSDKSDCSDPWSVMGELEFAAGQHLFPTHALGASYRALRAFRPLLFVDLDKIPASSLLQDLPPSVVLHHLFSRAPPELLSPFTCSLPHYNFPPSPPGPPYSPPQDLPPSVVLHHLFSRAPPELLSPFTRIQQPPARYSLWLDQHSQQQAWQGIKASLDDYVGSVKARGGKEFHPVYAVMLQLGQTLLHSQQQAWQGIKASSVDDYVGSVKARGGKEFHPVYLVMLQLGQSLLLGPGNEGK